MNVLAGLIAAACGLFGAALYLAQTEKPARNNDPSGDTNDPPDDPEGDP